VWRVFGGQRDRPAAEGSEDAVARRGIDHLLSAWSFFGVARFGGDEVRTHASVGAGEALRRNGWPGPELRRCVHALGIAFGAGEWARMDFAPSAVVMAAWRMPRLQHGGSFGHSAAENLSAAGRVRRICFSWPAAHRSGSNVTRVPHPVHLHAPIVRGIVEDETEFFVHRLSRLTRHWSSPFRRSHPQCVC